jgi:hypothetical protein
MICYFVYLHAIDNFMCMTLSIRNAYVELLYRSIIHCTLELFSFMTHFNCSSSFKLFVL